MFGCQQQFKHFTQITEFRIIFQSLCLFDFQAKLYPVAVQPSKFPLHAICFELNIVNSSNHQSQQKFQKNNKGLKTNFLLCLAQNKKYLYFWLIFSHRVAMSVSLDVCVKIQFSKHWPSGPMLSISRNVRPSVCLSVRVSVCPCVRLFTFEVPFNGLFASTSRSRMSNIFRDLESLGKEVVSDMSIFN